MQAIHAFDPRVLENVDGASWRCLSGVRVNRQIIQLVPNMKVHNNLTRYIHICYPLILHHIWRPTITSELFPFCYPSSFYSTLRPFVFQTWCCLPLYHSVPYIHSVIFLSSASAFVLSMLKFDVIFLLELFYSDVLFMSSLNLSCYNLSYSNFSLFMGHQCRNFNICCGVLNYGREKEDFIAM